MSLEHPVCVVFSWHHVGCIPNRLFIGIDAYCDRACIRIFRGSSLEELHASIPAVVAPETGSEKKMAFNQMNNSVASIGV